MISTHILDTAKGVPASNVAVTLSKLNGKKWELLASGKTDADGRSSFPGEMTSGMYQLLFEVRTAFYESIPVQFKVEDTKRKYHVPLLLSPFGYSTYRGS